ncbi:MAG: hypothetical protein E7282_08555 [Lachnospiraceae bacterium]|nr:hypothetical protein [Lachnospiraceae bacterium]
MKRWIRPVVLLVVFVLTIIAGSLLMNKTNKDLTSSLEEASLPVVYFTYDDITINELHGYVNEMNQCAMRDTITPIQDDRLLHVKINTYGTPVDSIRYEIRSLDGERLVADGEITEYTSSGNTISYDAEVENLLENNEEYVYRITLSADGRDVYYYTRLERTVDRNVPECLAFAKEFHDYTLNGEGASFIPTYMDPATGDATTLHYVDLTCTLNQITWSKFEGEVATEVIADIKEISDTYNVIVLNYVMSYKNEAGETEFYNVEEYYRLRNTETRMYVLNFERTMTQIFSGENEILSDAGNLQLGIRDTDVEYRANDAGDIIAFVQEGELWCYNAESNHIARVFSFRSLEGLDIRENWEQHDIKIVSVDEAGSVDFVVYGYMNRGNHEGEVGVAVYHYDGLSHTIEEEIFIQCDQSYEVLKAELGQLLYVNEQETLFLIMAGDLYQVDLASKSATVLIENINSDSYAVSQSGQYFAYIDPTMVNEATQIKVVDLRNLSTYEINAESGTYLRTLGFIDDDLIYGIANTKDVLTDDAGNVSFAMSALKIMDVSDGSPTELKNYTPSSGYISGISVEDYIITVNLEKLSGGSYVSNGTDTIMNREADTEQNVLITTTVSDVKETQVQLELVNTKNTEAKMITSQLLVSDSDTDLNITLEEASERFYVYEKGTVVFTSDSISDAIDQAYAVNGVVVDQGQSYVWNRSMATSVSPFTGLEIYDTDEGGSSITCSVSAMLMREEAGIAVADLIENGTAVYDILKSALKDAIVLDVSGCTLEEVLYYISEGSPVFAMTGTDKAVLLTGYTSSVVYYFDTASQSTASMSISDAEALFASSGNIFITYLK